VQGEVAQEQYTWRPPGTPVSIEVKLEVVDGLGADVMRGFGAVRRRGAEVGGLLLGHRTRRNGELFIQVTDFVPVSCEYQYGPSYQLSPNDLNLFRKDLATFSAPNDTGALIIGYYRSHTRPGLTPDEADIEFFHQYFTDTDDIVLLVKPFASKPPLAGFFLQERGRLVAGASLLEFPFRRRELTSGEPFEGATVAPAERPAAVERPAPAPPPPPIVEPPPPAPPVAEPVRAIPVRIAHPEPVSPPPEVVAPPVTAHPAQPVQRQLIEESIVPPAGLNPPPRPRPSPLIDPLPAPLGPPAPPPRPRAQVEEPPIESQTGTLFAHVQPPPSRWKARFGWLALGITLITFGVVLGHQYTNSPLGSGSVSSAAPDPYSLTLQATRVDDNILVRWDRDSLAVKGGWRGQLTISEGPDSKVVQMDVPQLQNGEVLYRHVAPEIVFKLEVFIKDQRSVVESLTWRMPQSERARP
jgi:hypothetical protein